jgi:UDP:flavonoid glycosyltransferase YjiC (YdhE family)
VAFVITTAWGTLGDALPFIAVGAELRRRGHEVALVASPAFERQAREAGIELVPVGTLDAHRAFVEDPRLWDRDTVLSAVTTHWLRAAQGLYEAIVRIHRPGKTVLFAGPTDVPARLAQEKLGLPFASGLLTPCRMGSRFDPPHPSRPFPAWTDPFVRTRWGLRLLHRLRRAAPAPLGGSAWAALSEVRRLRQLAGLPEELPATDALRTELLICFWPSWFSPRQKDWPEGARTASFPFHLGLPGRDPAPTSPGDRPRTLVFTRGSSASHQKAFFSAAAECCRLLKRPGVLVTPHAADVPSELPPGTTHQSFASFGELFPRAAAVVHHGGVGTIAHALAAGIPQVILPIVGEQFDLGYRVERLGVGRMLTPAATTASHLARETGALVASAKVLARCERYRGEVFPLAGASLAAEWIEALAARVLPRAS